MKFICKQCNKEFEMTASEIEYFRSKNLNIPKRCRNCREMNRQTGNNYTYNSDKAKLINYKTIIIILSLVIVLILIVAGTAIYMLSPEDKPDTSAVITHTVQNEPVTTTTKHTTVTAVKHTAHIVQNEPVTTTTTTTTSETTEQVTTTTTTQKVTTKATEITYYLNTYRKKFHKPDCESVQQMNRKNRKAFYGTRDEAIAQGYSPCENCQP
ncbi:MAG: zinc-ribbon domain-containing protein [Ruminococcus sp.]|nr:zinc-ribbon domain-containing protein [Ruminococcus sp.]